jgi:hypothetical protein
MALATAFGVSAAITIVFNKVLAWLKNAPNSFIASLTAHHRTTHGLVDVAVFLAVASDSGPVARDAATFASQVIVTPGNYGTDKSATIDAINVLSRDSGCA